MIRKKAFLKKAVSEMKGQIIETMDIVDKSLLKFCLCGYNLRVGFWVTISFVIREQE